jgi:competence protein ComEC
MTLKAMLCSYTILISIFFFDVNFNNLFAFVITAIFLCLYCKVPPILVLIFISFSWSALYKNTVVNEANSLFNNATKQNVRALRKTASDHIITAEIITLVNNKNVLSFAANVTEIDGRQLFFPKPKIVLKWYNYQSDYASKPSSGQQWRFKVRLKPINSVNKSRLFSYQTEMLAKHIRYSGYILQGEIIDEGISARAVLYKQFESVLPEQPNSMLYALSFGDRSHVTKVQWTQYQQLGISHLIAISGLHIGLIFGFCYLFIQFASTLIRQPANLFLCLALSLAGAIFYAWIAGFSLPAIRAIVLLCISCLYRVLQLKITLLQLFMLMLVTTLCINPLTVYSLSFWLSFSAMASVFILSWFFHFSKTTGRNTQDGSVVHPVLLIIAKTFLAQLLLTLLLLPVQGIIFDGFSWLSPFVNLIFIPVFSFFILPALLFGVMILPVWPDLTALIYSVMNYLLEGISYLWTQIVLVVDTWVSLDSTSSSIKFIILMYALLLGGYIVKPLRKVANSLLLTLVPLSFLQLYL